MPRRLGLLLIAGMLISNSSLAKAQGFRSVIAPEHNGPGLRCYSVAAGGTSKVAIYSRPTDDSPAIGYKTEVVAATGAPVGKYLPVFFTRTVTGWVYLDEVIKDRYLTGDCTVKMRPDGSLAFSIIGRQK